MTAMGKQKKEVVRHTFEGGRFADHGLDVDVVVELMRYRELLTEVAKELWRRRHPDRKNLPPNYEKSLALRFYQVIDNCATIPLVREVEVGQGQPFDFAQEDELDDAVALVAKTIAAAASGHALPLDFPKPLLGNFRNYGQSLQFDEWIEHRTATNQQLCRYDAEVKSRLVSWADSSYDDYAEVTGEVTMARVSKPRMSIELRDGREIEAAFRAEDEETITTALQQHKTARLQVVGRGQFSVDGVLQRLIEVEQVRLLPSAELPVDEAAKPIWEEFATILGAVPAEELAKLPLDGAENHDFYIYGATREAP